MRASHLALARAAPKDGMLDTVEGNVDNASRLESRGTQYIVLAARVTAACPRRPPAHPRSCRDQPQSKRTRVSGPWRSSASAVIASTTRRSSSIAGAACSPIRAASRSNAAASSR